VVRFGGGGWCSQDTRVVLKQALPDRRKSPQSAKGNTDTGRSFSKYFTGNTPNLIGPIYRIMRSFHSMGKVYIRFQPIL
jgi:hypothetical protein